MNRSASRALAIALLLALPGAAAAQEGPLRQSARKSAEAMYRAFNNGEYEKFADSIHPNFVKKVGGRDELAAKLRSEMRKMKDQGFDFPTFSFEDAKEPIRRGKEAYLVVPIVMETHPPGEVVRRTTSLVGFTEDDGKTWYFIDATPGLEQLRKLIPGIPAELEVPGPEQTTRKAP